MKRLRFGFVLFFAMVMSKAGVSAQAPVPVTLGEGACKEILNSEACARVLEAQQIALSQGRAQRDGELLQLRLRGGTYQKITTISRGTESVTFYYLGILEPIGYYVLFVQYQQGSAIGVVNELRGWSRIMSDIPIPSPDRRRMVTPFSVTHDSAGLVVWIAEADTLRREWSIGSKVWTPQEVRWLSSRALAFQRNLDQVQGPLDTAEVDSKGHWTTRLADGP